MRNVRIAVLGGGITGQLVQVQIPTAEVFDWHPRPVGTRNMTRSYGANYLWEPLPGIPCRGFTVKTRIDGMIPTLDAIVQYKVKIGKGPDVANAINAGQFQDEMAGWDIESMPATTIQYGYRAVAVDRLNHTIQFAGPACHGTLTYDVLVSTIPLYSLLSLLGIPEPQGRLQHKPIYFKVMSRPPDAPFPPDVLYVNYLSNPNIVPYRYCDRNGERHFESIIPYPGATSAKRIIPGKIYAHTETPDILEFLSSFNIHTFGRFGSWNPDELVHETWARIDEWKENI